MGKKIKTKLVTPKMVNIWASEKNQIRLRKLRLVEKEPDNSVLTRVLNRIELVGINDNRVTA